MIILYLLCSVIFFGIGEYYSKKFAINPSIKLASIVILLYAGGSAMWLPAILKGKTLSTIGTTWNVLSMLTTLIVGVVIFKEVLTTTQIIGIILSFVSIVLISI